jgi:hypothetical protein
MQVLLQRNVSDRSICALCAAPVGARYRRFRAHGDASADDLAHVRSRIRRLPICAHRRAEHGSASQMFVLARGT